MANDWKKIGNRYYKVEGDFMVKATYNYETKSYNECGRWPMQQFDSHEQAFDGNTEKEYAKIVSTLNVKDVVKNIKK